MSESRKSSSDEAKRKELERRKASEKAKQSDSRKSSKTIDEYRAEKHKAFVEACIKSHAGWLGTISTPLSSSLDVPPEHIQGGLGLLFILLHLLAPPAMVPHFASTVTLLIPLQSTLLSIANELNSKAGKPAARDSSQWLVFWVGYMLFGMIRGWVTVFKPEWKGWFELGRSIWLIILGGPWFGKAWLKPPETTRAQKDAEKAAEAETAGRAKREKERETKEERQRKTRRGRRILRRQRKSGRKQRRKQLLEENTALR